MGKQTKSLGSLTDIQAPAPEPPDNRFDNLEKRIAQLETLLNDVMQQLDQPYRDQQLGNGKPKQTKPKQAKPKQANPSTPKAKKAPTPPTPPLSEEERQANDIAIIAFLSQNPDKLWHGKKLQTAIEELCTISKQHAINTIKHLRKIGHFTIIKDVEVDGKILGGAYQFILQPEPTEKQIATQEKVIALEKEQHAISAQHTADALEKLLSLLENDNHITPENLIDIGISKKRQQKLRRTDSYKASGIQYQKLPDETHEYSIESAS